MTVRLILGICFKVIGVFYALKALNMFPQTITQLAFTWDLLKATAGKDPLMLTINYKLAVVGGLLIPVLLFGIALILILKSDRIAILLDPREESVDSALPDTFPKAALSICIKIFGFFSILSSVPHLSELLSRWWIMKAQLKYYDTSGKIGLTSAVMSIVLYVGVGSLLIMYSDSISQKLSHGYKNGVKP